jgi:hypothetical protein
MGRQFNVPVSEVSCGRGLFSLQQAKLDRNLLRWLTEEEYWQSVTTPSAAAPADSVVDLTAAADVEGPATKKRKQIPATKKGKHAAVSAAATIWQSLRNRSKPRQAGTASIGVDAGAWGASKIVVENAE